MAVKLKSELYVGPVNVFLISDTVLPITVVVIIRYFRLRCMNASVKFQLKCNEN